MKQRYLEIEVILFHLVSRTVHITFSILLGVSFNYLILSG